MTQHQLDDDLVGNRQTASMQKNFNSINQKSQKMEITLKKFKKETQTLKKKGIDMTGFCFF